MPECWINDKWEMVLNADTISIQSLLGTSNQRMTATLKMPCVLAIVEALTKERRPLSIAEYRRTCSDIFNRSFTSR